VATERETLELFAESLCPSDEVAMEATGPAMEIARILEPHVARVVVANAQEVRAISHARVKSDRFDARTLANLLGAGMLESVWVPDPETQGLRRRVARRASLVRQRTRAKNEIHAALSRSLLGRSPVADLFTAEGRAWLQAQELGEEEAETVAGCLRQIDFLDGEVAEIDTKLAQWTVSSPEAKRLMSIPGVGAGVAVTLMAAIGDVSRFSGQRQLVAYLGLDPKVRQSGEEAPRHGRISKRGNAQARSALVEAAWMALRQPGPLRAFGERVRARRGAQVAAVAVARKLACIAWQLLTKEEDYVFAQPSKVRAKLRRAELNAGAPPLRRGHGGQRISATPGEREAERELVARGEAAYQRLIADWQATSPAKKGAGATPGRASSGPSTGQAARQAKAPGPAL
jgi:transposase